MGRAAFDRPKKGCALGHQKPAHVGSRAKPLARPGRDSQDERGAHAAGHSRRACVVQRGGDVAQCDGGERASPPGQMKTMAAQLDPTEGDSSGRVDC
jgi:hypothetical protein